MSVQKMLMNWNAVYILLLISCLLVSLYIHFVEEWDTADEYNKHLEQQGINAENMHTNADLTLNEDIDIVYTWVNGSEPKFNRQLREYLRSINRRNSGVMELNRYFDIGTLKYSLRSIEMYANWVRHIFVVTNGQIPTWLKLEHPKLTLVTHEEIFPNKSHLPTFASPAIECHLHRITGLSRRFIYLNDNIMLTSKLKISDLVTIGGKYKIRFMAERPYRCNKHCNVVMVNNGICDKNCSTASCEWDGDDCIGQKVPPYTDTDKDFMFDSWMGSVMHTYFILNKHYGPKDRYIAEHGAHLFDKSIIYKLNKRFPEEWDRTSSHKIRHHLSVQFQFVYIQYLKESGQIDVKTDMRSRQKVGYKVKFNVDNRSREARKKQMELVEMEIKLKKAMYLIVTNSFTMELSEEGKAEIIKDVTSFFDGLYPVPSSFEI